MSRGLALGLGLVVGVLAAWLLGLAFNPLAFETIQADATDTDEDLREEIRRLANDNADLRRKQAYRHPTLEASPTEDGGAAPPPNPSKASVRPQVDRFVRWRRTSSMPVDIPKALRGKPELWIEALRGAVAAGNTGHAHYFMMALVAVGADAVDPLTSVLQNADEHMTVRLQALTALRSLAPTRLAGIAESLIQYEARGSPLRGSALDALARSPPTSVSKTVVDIAHDSDAPMGERKSAMTVIMHVDPQEAEDLFRRLLRDGNVSEKRTTYQVLAQARRKELHGFVTEVIKEAPNRQKELLQAVARMKGPGWGNEQMTGAPDTPVAGDSQTAWASRQAQEGTVWVECDFAVEVRPERVRVHETFNAGAIVKVEARSGNGSWETLWAGEARAAGTPRWFSPALEDLGERTRTIRLTLDTDKVSGWNEIDAVELIGDDQRQWASGARSSSCYAHRGR